jgi:3-oxoacyl-[acyl-carrier-protein] synthase II
MKPALNRVVAVTGLGAVTPDAIGTQAFWASLFQAVEPRSVRRVQGFDPRSWMSHKDVKHSDIATQFAVAAAHEALIDSGMLAQPDGEPSGAGSDDYRLTGVDLARAAVSLGTGIGGVATLEAQAEVLRTRGERRVSPFVVTMTMPNAAAAALSIRYGLAGPVSTTTTACAAGTDAIAVGARWVASGVADVVIAGGTDSSLTPTCVAGFANMGALSKSGMSRPFDKDRDGLAAAEACGILVLEPLEHAQARGAHIYTTIQGTASTADAHHITAPPADGSGAQRCMTLVIEDAGLAPADITHINAHGTATGLNDAAEGRAIRQVFGESRPVVTSIKGVTGHSFGAAGAVEAVAVALAMHHRTIPPTVGLTEQDPAIDLDVARSAVPWRPGPTISNSFGFGGQNGSLVLAPVE